MKIRIVILFVFIAFSSQAWTQFSIDLLSCQFQTGKVQGHQIQNGFVNVLVPKQLKSGHVFLTRIAYEYLHESIDSLEGRFHNLSIPIGFNWKLSNENRLTTLLIPKLSGEEMGISRDIAQLGFYGFFQHQSNPDFRYRIGVYYNREFFGNFIVPLVGVDWKINNHLSLFGTLPNSMKFMYTTTDGMYSIGFAFRSLMRSYRLNFSDPNAFVRFNENQLKFLNEFKISDRWIVQADFGYFITQTPLLYKYGYRKEIISSDLYKPLKSFPMLNVGLVYRLPTN